MLKIHSPYYNFVSSVSFKSRWNFEEDIDPFDEALSFEDVTDCHDEEFDLKYPIKNAGMEASEFKHTTAEKKTPIQNALKVFEKSHNLSRGEREKIEKSAKAYYIFAYSKCGNNDELMKKEILNYLTQKFPKPKIEPQKSEIKPCVSASLQENKPELNSKVRKITFWKNKDEKRDFIIKCTSLSAKFADSLNDEQKKLMQCFLKNDADSNKTAKELGLQTGHVNSRVNRILDKFEKELSVYRKMRDYNTRLFYFLKDVVKVKINEDNKGTFFARYEQALEKLTIHQRNVISLRFLDSNKNTYEECGQFMTGMDKTGAYIAVKQAITKLRKFFDVKPKLTPEEKIEFMKKHPQFFSEKEIEIIEKRYDKKGRIIPASIILEANEKYKHQYDITKYICRINAKIENLYLSPEIMSAEEENKKVVEKFYEAKKHLLNPVQNEIINCKYNKNMPLSVIGEKLNIKHSTMSREHLKALQILKGKIKIDSTLEKTNEREKLADLFEEKKFFFTPYQQQLFEAIHLNNRKMSREEIMKEYRLTLKQYNTFQKESYDLITSMSVEKYYTAREKLRDDVKGILEKGAVKTPCMADVMREYFVENSGKTLEQIGEERNVEKARTRTLQILKRAQIETELPNFII